MRTKLILTNNFYGAGMSVVVSNAHSIQWWHTKYSHRGWATL